MKIGILTSSRADFGIYTPLIEQLTQDSYFSLEIIAFGTHLSKNHGATLSEIEQVQNAVIRTIPTEIADGSPADIAAAYSNVVEQFSTFWANNTYDLVLCLGDRYEMNGAVQAGIPFSVKFGHFHGGEKTLGAIDNIYRHQISLASAYHFTAAEAFSERVRSLIDTDPETVFTVGSMSLSDLETYELYSRETFNAKFSIPDRPFILCTVHPETVEANESDHFSDVLIETFEELKKLCHLVVNLPNADTYGAIFRSKLERFGDENPETVTLIESFGKKGYFTAMKASLFLLGNSSSGIIEAASFAKFAINIGNRQKGRLQSGNVIDVPFDCEKIVSAAKELLDNPRNFSGKNEYVQRDTIPTILHLLKSIGDGKL